MLQLCTHILVNGETLPLNENIRAEIMSVNDEYARRALRVWHWRVAICRRVLVHMLLKASSGELTFLGLTAMMDPPRPEVERAIAVCHQAGIRIVMITGDYGLTAQSLAGASG